LVGAFEGTIDSGVSSMSTNSLLEHRIRGFRALQVGKLGRAPAALRVAGSAALAWGGFLGLGLITAIAGRRYIFAGTLADWTGARPPFALMCESGRRRLTSAAYAEGIR
jgi:hypothetical protein